MDINVVLATKSYLYILDILHWSIRKNSFSQLKDLKISGVSKLADILPSCSKSTPIVYFSLLKEIINVLL